MKKRYAILTANGFFYGYDTDEDCGIYVKREYASTWPTKQRAEKVMKKYGLHGQIVNLD